MEDASKSALKNQASQTGNLFAKYTSLVHILRGEEEFVLNPDGFIIGSNLEAVNVTGYEEYEILGSHISIFYLPEEREKANEDLARASIIGNSFVTGLRLKKRGVNFWAAMKIRSINSSHPGGPGFVVILQDVTHRVLSKERIRSIRSEYFTVFNNPFVGTFKFRMTDYRVQMCNDKTLEILGKQNSAGLRFDRFFASSQQFALFISTLQEEKKVEGFKFLLQDERTNQDNWAVISAIYSETQGFVEGVLFDISEQHSQMMELQRVNDELDNLIYHASHELRSPLTSIMGLVNLGFKESSIDATHTYFEMIRGRVEHLDTLLKDLVFVSYNNGAGNEHELFCVEDEVRWILKSLENPNLIFKIDLAIIQPCEFITDSIRMRVILRNLFSNAFKYYNPLVPMPTLNVNIHVDPSQCRIQLRDNGIGINPEFKDKVYDMFSRATERSTGSGLGLYIVKSMVEKLNGEISFESASNLGTTFSLRIPNVLSSRYLNNNNNLNSPPLEY